MRLAGKRGILRLVAMLLIANEGFSKRRCNIPGNTGISKADLFTTIFRISRVSAQIAFFRLQLRKKINNSCNRINCCGSCEIDYNERRVPLDVLLMNYIYLLYV